MHIYSSEHPLSHNPFSADCGQPCLALTLSTSERSAAAHTLPRMSPSTSPKVRKSRQVSDASGRPAYIQQPLLEGFSATISASTTSPEVPSL